MTPDLDFLVGLTGFEPATPCPPDKCANQAALQPAIADNRPDRNASSADFRLEAFVPPPFLAKTTAPWYLPARPAGLYAVWVNTPTRVLVAILGGAGVAHFATPKHFDEIVPRALPGPARMWTSISGVAELGVAVTVAVPRSRDIGAVLAAVVFVVVFPANVQMAINWADRPLAQRVLAYGRLPLQIPLMWLALRVRRSAVS